MSPHCRVIMDVADHNDQHSLRRVTLLIIICVNLSSTSCSRRKLTTLFSYAMSFREYKLPLPSVGEIGPLFNKYVTFKLPARNLWSRILVKPYSVGAVIGYGSC